MEKLHEKKTLLKYLYVSYLFSCFFFSMWKMVFLSWKATAILSWLFCKWYIQDPFLRSLWVEARSVDSNWFWNRKQCKKKQISWKKLTQTHGFLWKIPKLGDYAMSLYWFGRSLEVKTSVASISANKCSTDKYSLNCTYNYGLDILQVLYFKMVI